MAQRIVAVVLPHLACEIAKSRDRLSDRPVAVLFDLETGVIDAACVDARRYGVRPGQKVADAKALTSRLAVLHVTFAELDRVLGRVAERLIGLGVVVSLRLISRAVVDAWSQTGDGPYNTVWVDITGSSQIKGGEQAVLGKIVDAISDIGFTAHIAIADGPRIAQALARWGVTSRAHLIAEEGRGGEALTPLPVRALPLPPDRIAFLLRVGVLTVGDLAKLPRTTEALSRLGPGGAEALAVAAGFDFAQLLPFVPLRAIDKMHAADGVD